MYEMTRMAWVRRLEKPAVWITLGIAAIVLAGCRVNQPAARTFEITGIVVSSDPARGEVTLDTQAIPGYMPAMIMPYQLSQPEGAKRLQPGDQITARLRVSNAGDQLDQIHVSQKAQPMFRPAITYNQPKPGQKAPDFSFIDQDGQSIHLDQFRGKAVLITFIYTRCPLPDYCIRMSRNFAEIHRGLAAKPGIYAKTHLLTVSFDPAHDTPKVLRRYGETYIGGNDPGKAFAHWSFAAPPEAELKQVEEFFDVGVTPAANGTLNHSLSTVLLGKDGTILEWYPSNNWNPADVLQALERAAG